MRIRLSPILGCGALGAALLSACLSSTSDSGDPTVSSDEHLTQSGVLGVLAISSDWGTGYCGTVTLTNVSSTAVTGWQATLNTNGSTISQVWNGGSTQTTGSVVVSPVSWDAAISPNGGTASFGFCATGSGRATLTALSIVGGGSPASSSSSSGGHASSSSSSSSGNTGATGVQCGLRLCSPPMSCCESASGSPSCVIACTLEQKQLCAHDADCQSSGTAMCVGGFCTDTGPTDGGVVVPPLDGGIAPPPTNAGTIPAGYPQPTAANRAQCKTVPMGQGPGVYPGYCPGGGKGPVCIQCLFGGSTYDSSSSLTPSATETNEAGDYLVTVELGGSSAGDTYISTETDRALLATTKTAAGKSVEYAFAINVRAREGQPNQNVSNGYPGLDLYFSGTNPQVSAIGYARAMAATQPITVYIASDSTTCDQTDQDFAGWGQALPEYFAPSIVVANYADSGESSSSFFGAYRWPEITKRWKAGDWVLIQFGHNDKGVADSVVQANLEKYVSQALAAKVTPIVVSPPARVQMVNNVETDQSSLHAAAAQAAAKAKNVAYIDLTTLSTAWYNSLGSKTAAMQFHALGTDATHTNMAGAVKIAGLVATAMKNQKITLSKYLR